MPHKQNLNCRLARSLSRRLNRRATTWIGAGSHPRPPDYLAIALRAWRKVIRARRRLMKLAPELYDVALIDRLTLERAESDRTQAEMRAIIARVYGVPESDLPPDRRSNPFSKVRSPQALRAIAHEEAERERWLNVGREAYELFFERRPHACGTLSQIAGLLDVASQLGRLATGLETLDRPSPETISPSVSFRDALQKVYGTPSPNPADAAEARIDQA